MIGQVSKNNLNKIKKKYPDKFTSEEIIFENIHRGDIIFIGTGCGEPQYLVNALVKYTENNPKAFFDAEVIHVWTLGVAPYTEEKFKNNFRHNSFFISNNTRDSVNRGLSDYTPIFLSKVPQLFKSGAIAIDVVLMQCSLPDTHGYVNLGISVDIVKAAVESAKVVIAQVNSNMPRVFGDAFVHIEQIDYLLPFDEPLLEYNSIVPDDISSRIGKYVSRIVKDGDTIQVGYGSMPNAILASLSEKKDLGIHTELLTEGAVELIKRGVVNNSKKELDKTRTVAAFCMGTDETYKYIHNNPDILFKTIEYTNDPMIIGSQKNIIAINSALEMDLTGQASAESIGSTFFSGIGGSADFMRGALLAPGGKTILAMRSTSNDGKYSRIVPFLSEGSGITLTRGDVRYVITEYGIAYLHGKNIRERAMALIAIAAPEFRPWLIDRAKELNLIYNDQAFVPGKVGEYPEHLEIYKNLKNGTRILLRPVKISDEDLLKEFFYSLSDKSMYERFFTVRKDMHHNTLQKFVIIDYSKALVLLAIIEEEGSETIIGVGQYAINKKLHTADLALVVKDDWQNQGVGRILIQYLTNLAKREGLLGFTADILYENYAMLHLIDNMGFKLGKAASHGEYEMKIWF